MNKCIYKNAYVIAPCNKDCTENFCEEHLNIKCVVCKKQAYHECNYCSQFVCGAPLCNKHTGYEYCKKEHEAYIFLNHGHK